MKSKTIRCSDSSRLRIRVWPYDGVAHIDCSSDWGLWANATPKKLRQIANACNETASEIEAQNKNK